MAPLRPPRAMACRLCTHAWQPSLRRSPKWTCSRAEQRVENVTSRSHYPRWLTLGSAAQSDSGSLRNAVRSVSKLHDLHSSSRDQSTAQQSRASWPFHRVVQSWQLALASS